ncbi:MAG: RNA polymerase sigma factor [Chitinophagales bacterium]
MTKKSKEKAILEGCLQGSRKYQELLYKQYSGKMFAIALRYAKDYHSAEDILQEGFVKVFRNIHRFRGDGSFEGWMRRIFVNTAIEHFRKIVHTAPIMDATGSNKDITNDQTLSKLAANDLLALVSSLSPGYRTVFNLYVIEGYSHKEIAKMLSISEGTSKSQLARARYLLQDKVNQLYSNSTKKTYV